MDTLEPAAPDGAVVLFDGSNADAWQSTKDSGPYRWKVEEGALHIVPKTGDIVSRQPFEDHYLHLEFRGPDMPEATGQKKGNSGVYLQGRYEVQVLDSSGWNVPGKGDCGAVYDQFAPLTNACKPAMEWQTYDIFFRSPRFDDAGTRTEGPRLTVLLNGVCIQNNVELPGVTGGAMDEKVAEPGPLRLQDHGDLVSYRNIWVVPLSKHGSDTYKPH